MADRKHLNNRTVAALRPAVTNYDVYDVLVPGLAVRVTTKGAKSYVLVKRMPGEANPTRRTIAKVGAIELDEARCIARDWLAQIRKGFDPKEVEEARAAEARNDAFDAVAETYIAERLDGKKKADIARVIRREFGGQKDDVPIGPWAGKPIRTIKTRDVADLVVAKSMTAPTQARNMLSHLARLMRWAVAKGLIEYSPAAQIRPGDLLGKVVPRARVLTDEELKRLWKTAEIQRYPWGSIYLLLILTGCRLNEVVDARWSEFDLRRGVWTIPAGRMKGKLAHAVPITSMMSRVLARLPRWNGGDHLFSCSNGVDSVTVTNHIKDQIDVATRIYGWRNHDIRRTMRSHLSALPIEEHVREIMIAHKRKGLQATYDLFQYFEEKRVGFELWHARLSAIVDPPAVAPLRLVG